MHVRKEGIKNKELVGFVKYISKLCLTRLRS